MENLPLNPPSSPQHNEPSNQCDDQQLFPRQPSFDYIVQFPPPLFFTNNDQPSNDSPVFHDSNIFYTVCLPVIVMPENDREVLMTDSSDHNSQVNFEVEQMGRDDSRISDMANSSVEDTRVFLEHAYNEISNTPEVGDESPGISARTSFTLFGVVINVPPREEEDDEQQADHNTMLMPENNHPSVFHYPEEGVDPSVVHYPEEGVDPSVVHYPEEGVAMVLVAVPDSLDSDDDDLTTEEYVDLEEQMGQVNSGLSEETIMGHVKIKYYTLPTTLSLNEEREICVICQGEYEYGEFTGGLHCGHKYHVQCIKKWLQQKNNCPICKATAVS